MHPGAGDDRAHATGHKRSLFDGNTMRFDDMAREAVEIAHERPEARRVAALTGRAAVSARVPGEDRALRQVEAIDQILQPTRMLMPTMEENEGVARCLPCRPPAIE